MCIQRWKERCLDAQMATKDIEGSKKIEYKQKQLKGWSFDEKSTHKEINGALDSCPSNEIIFHKLINITLMKYYSQC